jgi:hypothetical protein
VPVTVSWQVDGDYLGASALDVVYRMHRVGAAGQLRPSAAGNVGHGCDEAADARPRAVGIGPRSPSTC